MSGYCNNVDIETRLRNTIHPKQKGNAQGMYIPDTSSDLFNLKHVALYEDTPLEKQAPHNPNKCGIGNNFCESYKTTNQEYKIRININ